MIQREKIAKDLLRRYNIRVVKYRERRSGCANLETREIEAPFPKNTIRLLHFVHQVAKIVNKDIEPNYFREYKAYRWTFNYLRKQGVTIPDGYLYKAKARVLAMIMRKNRYGNRKTILHKDVINFINIKGKTRPLFPTGRKRGKKYVF
jgi:hypothetical protein